MEKKVVEKKEERGNFVLHKNIVKNKDTPTSLFMTGDLV